MDAVDDYLQLALKQSLGNRQPPAQARERLMQAAAQMTQSTVQATIIANREPHGENLHPEPQKAVSPWVRAPRLETERGWG